MNFFKKIIINFLQKENKSIEKILDKLVENNKVCFLDIGASGGIPNRWIMLEKFLNKILAEPNSTSAKKIKKINQIEKFSHVLKNKIYNVI